MSYKQTKHPRNTQKQTRKICFLFIIIISIQSLIEYIHFKKLNISESLGMTEHMNNYRSKNKG